MTAAEVMVANIEWISVTMLKLKLRKVYMMIAVLRSAINIAWVNKNEVWWWMLIVNSEVWDGKYAQFCWYVMFEPFSRFSWNLLWIEEVTPLQNSLILYAPNPV
jgi:hypothetical protein